MTAHTVRRMRTCIICGGIGVHHPKAAEGHLPTVVCIPPAPVTGTASQFAHPRCVVFNTAFGLEVLLSLPDEELGFIWISDVGKKTMAAILNRNK